MSKKQEMTASSDSKKLVNQDGRPSRGEEWHADEAE